MAHLAPSFTPRRLTVAVFVLLAFLSSHLFAAEPARVAPRDFDVPAGGAEQALKKFSTQAGIEVVFATKAVDGIMTPAVKGEYAPMDALAQLLAGTPLVAKTDARTGAVVVSKEGPPGPNAPRVAQTEATTPKSQGKVEDGRLVLDKVEVTGSRIRGLLGETTQTPVLVYTTVDFEQMGVQSFSDLGRYIPQLQVSGETAEIQSNGLSNNTGFVGQGGRVSFSDIRGLSRSNTLILVDGRRLPKTGQNNGFDAYDLNGIALSAVERIEILPAGDSAIYGTDAVSGVINFIMKRNRQYAETGFTYRNAWDTDTAQKTAMLNAGFASRGFSAQVNLEWKQNNGLAPRDRWWTASFDRRPFGGTDARGTIPDGQGIVRSTNGANLPGLNSPVATIPTNSDGRNVTIADYAAAGATPPVLDAGQYTDYAHSSAEKVRVAMEYEFKPWLVARAEATWGEKTTVRPGNYRIPVIAPGRTGTGTIAPATSFNGFALPASSITLPAGYPGNPFGVPIRVEKAFWDAVPLLAQDEINRNSSIEIGVRGDLPHQWAYQAYIRKSAAFYQATNDVFFSQPALTAALTNPDPAQQLIVLHNSQRFSPNSPELIRSLFEFKTSTERPIDWTYSAQADGPVWSLASGDIHAAVVAEQRESYTDFTYPPNDSAARTSVNRPLKRTITEYAGEVRVPLLGQARRWPGVHQLTVHGALRSMDDTFYPYGANVPSYGLLYQPVSWITLRASRSENFSLPPLNNVAGVVQTVDYALVASAFVMTDPRRGNQLVTYSFPMTTGANPDLKAESGRTDSVSLDVSVPRVKGLQFSVNYSDTQSTDRILNPIGQPQIVIDNFPDRVTRAAPSASDLAAGWAGPITAFDGRALNISRFRSTNLDVRVQYRRQFAGWGAVALSLDGTKPLDNYEIVLPNSPKSDYSGGRASRYALRGNWSKGPYSFGTAWLHTAKTRPPGAAASEALIPASDEIDFSLGYDFGTSTALSGWSRQLFRNLRLNARVLNAFPQDPKFRVSNGILLGRGNVYLREYQIDIRKSF